MNSEGKIAEAALVRLGFEFAHPPGGKEGDAYLDWLARRARRTYAVVVCAVKALSRRQEARLAEPLLRLARAQREQQIEPLLAVEVGGSFLRAAAVVEGYVQRYSPGASWLVVDPQGEATWNIDGEPGQLQPPGALNQSPPPLQADSALVERPRRDPFSPTFQWLLKVLLLAGIDKRLWGGPSRRPESITDLARLADVSQPHSSAFAAVMQARGYLSRRRRGAIVVTDIERLLDDWSHAHSVRRPPAVPARHLFPLAAGDGLQASVDRLRSYCEPYAVGGHYAADLLGLSRSNVARALLYVPSVSQEVMEALDLTAVHAEEGADISLAKPASGPAVFGGATEQRGVRVVDVLQCYLDVRHSAARGREQAEHLFERALRPHFEACRWL